MNNKVSSMSTTVNQKDLYFLKELINAGKIVPVIDRTYPFKDTDEAIRYLEEGHARGKVAITWIITSRSELIEAGKVKPVMDNAIR